MPSKAGPESRKVRMMSRQVCLALPAWVRRRLGVAPGALVYFHRHRGGEVVLTVKQERAGGVAGRRDLEEELAAVMAERDQWKRQALALDAGRDRAAFGQGVTWAQADRDLDAAAGGPIVGALRVLTRRVDEVLALLHARRTRPHRARAGAPAADAHPSPPAPPSGVVLDGGDAASGAAPPGRPAE